MVLNEKEKETIKSLQTQEKSCITKYEKYASDAKDTVLKDLFQSIKKNEQEHFDTLTQVLSGQVPGCDCNDSKGKDYNPTATYTNMSSSQEKDDDCFLATDAIATEKLVSSEYNTEVFKFADTAIRKLLADILVEEQNHAEMIYKYKTVNAMA